MRKKTNAAATPKTLPSFIADMVRAAARARANAYAPYSNFKVGAAIRTADGEIFAGCNAEEAAYEATHAEQNAIGTMIAAAGKKLITDVVVIGGESGDGLLCTPCGHCRQWLREHSSDATRIIVAGPEITEGKPPRLVTTLGALLPFSFGPENLAGNRKASRSSEKA